MPAKRSRALSPPAGTRAEQRWNCAGVGNAVERLAEIEEFIARDNPERAAIFVDSLIDHTADLLPINPRSDRIVPELSSPDTRELPYRNYPTVYCLVYERIEILTVFEGHRLLWVDELGD